MSFLTQSHQVKISSNKLHGKTKLRWSICYYCFFNL